MSINVLFMTNLLKCFKNQSFKSLQYHISCCFRYISLPLILHYFMSDFYIPSGTVCESKIQESCDFFFYSLLISLMTSYISCNNTLTLRFTLVLNSIHVIMHIKTEWRSVRIPIRKPQKNMQVAILFQNNCMLISNVRQSVRLVQGLLTHSTGVESKKRPLPAGVEPHTLLFCVRVVTIGKFRTIPENSARRMNVKSTEKGIDSIQRQNITDCHTSIPVMNQN